MEFNYPITLTPDPDDGGFVVTFPDLPEDVTQGETVAEALEEAQGALEQRPWSTAAGKASRFQHPVQ